MKYIFLDIDGVLNTELDWVELITLGHSINQGTEVINRTKLAGLARIIQQTGAKIVISSTWRICRSVDQIHNIFCKHGWKLPRDTIVGVTHREGFDGKSERQWYRDCEIKTYLDTLQDITGFVILDDSEIHDEELVDFWIDCYDDGLTYLKMNKAITMLQP